MSTTFDLSKCDIGSRIISEEIMYKIAALQELRACGVGNIHFDL
jgi:hypothetical protein